MTVAGDWRDARGALKDTDDRPAERIIADGRAGEDYVRRCESTVQSDPPLRCEQAVGHEGVHRIDSDPVRTVTWLEKGELAIGSPDFWPLVADDIGDHPYHYDLSDRSHLLDVVQIVCQSAVQVLKTASP